MMAKMPDVNVHVVPHIRIGEQWVPLRDLTPEQIALLREAYAKVIPADVEEMMARAWDMGVMAERTARAASEALGMEIAPEPNPFKGVFRG